MLIENLKPGAWDERRDLIVPGDPHTTLIFCVEHFVSLCKQAIQTSGFFHVALSGGSTPKAIFKQLTSPPYKEEIEWDKIHFFWSDERAVSPTDPESNYHMAMEAGLKDMPIPSHHLHRMCAEEEIEKNAKAYQDLIKKVLKEKGFDLIMLGMGEDGHTASLFPETEALHVKERLVVANFVPQKNTWRMTFTYDCINAASHIALYVLGASKKEILAQVLLSKNQPDDFPVQRVGTPLHRALWIADEAAAEELISKRPRT